METILLCSKSQNLQEHWSKSLINAYSDLISVTSESGLEKCLEKYNDIILILDCNFFVNSPEFIKSILDLKPNTKIIYMDDCPNFRDGKRLLAYNIKGYGNSRLSSIHLLQAISVVNSGNVWLYPEFIQELIKDITPSSTPKEIEGFNLLTNKEQSIANLVLKGCSNKKISKEMEISESTVKKHISAIFQKLHVNDRLSLALLLR